VAGNPCGHRGCSGHGQPHISAGKHIVVKTLVAAAEQVAEADPDHTEDQQYRQCSNRRQDVVHSRCPRTLRVPLKITPPSIRNSTRPSAKKVHACISEWCLTVTATVSLQPSAGIPTRKKYSPSGRPVMVCAPANGTSSC